MTLPIHHGPLFPDTRPSSKKFSRHIATIKYRFSLSSVFISHVYSQESTKGWEEGITPCVGVKALIETFQADLHQREQTITIKDAKSGVVKTIAKKPFHAAEVVITGLSLRVLRAVFTEPEKTMVQLDGKHEDEPTVLPPGPTEDFSSAWVDLDDFRELNWTQTDRQPRLWLLPIGECPRFTFFKRVSLQQASPKEGAGIETSKFGNEDTHVCFLGKQDCKLFMLMYF